MGFVSVHVSVCSVRTTCSKVQWSVHTPGQYTLQVSTHSWSVHTPG